MTLRHMQVFVAVCEQSSITRAAEKLYMAQPAVSRSVGELERYYGVRLFDRISGRLHITEQGRLLLNYARHIVALFDEMEKSIRDADTLGKMSIGASMTVGTVYMPHLVERFQEKNPEFGVSVRVDSSDIIERMVEKNELDFAVVEGPVHSPDLLHRTVITDRLVAVCSPLNPIAGEPSVSVERFVTEKFLLREKDSGTRQLFDSALAALGFSVSPAWESAATEALIMAVTHNLGVSVLAYAVVSHYLDAGMLAEITVTGLELTRSIRLIYHKNKYLSRAMQQFIALLGDQLHQ